jgi:hypothetical protein
VAPTLPPSPTFVREVRRGYSCSDFDRETELFQYTASFATSEAP